MTKPIVAALFLALAGGAAQAQQIETRPASAEQQHGHRLVIQVSDNDAARMNLALNNAVNVSKHYQEQGQDVQVEIVAYGPGLHMLRADTSPVKQRIIAFTESMPNVSFAACGNTIETMKKNEKKDVVILPKIKIIEAGVTRIMELQEQGWSYIRP